MTSLRPRNQLPSVAGPASQPAPRAMLMPLRTLRVAHPSTAPHRTSCHPAAARQRHLAAALGSGAACSGFVSSGGASSSGRPLVATWRDDAASALPAGGFLTRLRHRLFGNKRLDREKIARYGMGAFAAYGVISNLNACVLATLAWVAVVRQTGLTPLAPGQWPKFLAAYAGFYLAASLLRPLRLSMAVAAAPAFNAGLDAIERRMQRGRPAAFGVMLMMIAVTSLMCMAGGIVLAGGVKGLGV